MSHLLTRRRLLCGLPVLLAGCAGTGGLGSVQVTQRLRPGLTMAEVRTLLGPPASMESLGDGLVLKYSLHEYYKGWVPWYLAFGGNPPRLVSWAADEAAYRAQQALWLRSLETMAPPKVARQGPCQGGSVEDRIECQLREAKR